MERPRLYILDAHGYVFRAHYGLMNTSRGERQAVRLSTNEGMPTGALYVFARMLMALRNEVKPDRMAVVFDAPGRRGKRAELYPEYKATRSAPPEELTMQMPYFRPLVDAFRWPVMAVEGVEADDVIATLVRRARERGWDVVVYSADKDLMQLVGEGVEVIDAMRAQTFTREAVIEKFGVPPEQIADFLALCGDTSDNIPGVAGIGKVTAAKLLGEYGSIDGILAAAPTMKGKLKDKFTDPEQIERLRLSRRLVELDRDVELPLDLDALTVRPWDKDRLAQIFTELEFHAMLDKVQEGPRDGGLAPGDALPGGVATEGALAAHDDRPDTAPLAEPEVAISVAAVTRWVDAARAAGKVGVIVELDGERPDRCHLVGIGLGVPGVGSAYLPLGHHFIGAPPPPERTALAPVWAMFADPAVAKIVHDAKTATRVLADLGHALDGVVDDPMLAAFLLDSTKDPQAADIVAATAAGVPLATRAEVVGKSSKNRHSLEMVDVGAAGKWVGQIAEATARGAAPLRRRLARGGLEALYLDVELPVARILCDLERTGVCIDVDHLRRLSTDVSAQIAAIERRVFELVGTEVNLGSPKQLAALLFDKLGLESERMKKTKTGYSVDHDVLEGMIEAHPVIAPILEHREIVKLKGTYLDALPPLVHPRTGRLHTTFNQVVAATGRISSQDPNLQNIPIRSELGREIRRGFVAAPGKRLVAADYSQIELRILAHLSGDPVLLKAFRERVDVHTETAAEVFSIARDEVTPLQRRIAKAVNYGLAYGQSDFGLARALDIPRKEAKDYSDRYFERFPRIRQFMEDVVAEARARGGARTVLGRWRPIPDLTSKSPMARRAAERVAQNTPMQGTGADLIKLAMIRTTARLAADRLDATMILTVHDELVFEVADAHADALAAAVKEEMERVYELAVPLDVDVGIASNWADC